jgi:hypothetical protein
MKQSRTYPNSTFTILLITITLIVTLGALPINVEERDRIHFPVSVPQRNCHISQQPAKHPNTRSSNRQTRVHGRSLSFSKQQYQIYPCKDWRYAVKIKYTLLVIIPLSLSESSGEESESGNESGIKSDLSGDSSQVDPDTPWLRHQNYYAD